MQRISILATLATFASILVGCSTEADIGISQQEVGCLPAGTNITAEVHGTLTDPAFDEPFAFGITTPSVIGAPAVLTLSDRESRLQLSFSCGAIEVDTYGVHPADQTRPTCPLEVEAGLVGAHTEYMTPASGVVIIDENTDCLAGRFAMDFGSAGAIDGWFSVPWQ